MLIRSPSFQGCWPAHVQICLLRALLMWLQWSSLLAKAWLLEADCDWRGGQKGSWDQHRFRKWSWKVWQAATGQHKAESKIKPRLRGETVVYLNPSSAIGQLGGFGKKKHRRLCLLFLSLWTGENIWYLVAVWIQVGNGYNQVLSTGLST